MKLRMMSIRAMLLRNMMLTALVSIGTLFLFWGHVEYRAFVSESEAIRDAFVESQKELIQGEVTNVADYIHYMKDRTEERLRKGIRERVYEAHAIASNIYERNVSTRPLAEIKEMIKDALRPVRYNDGRGYYFAFNLEGVEELFAIRPEMEGLNMLPVKGASGEYVVRDMLDIVQRGNEGYYTYTWLNPGEDARGLRKIAFVKLFEPLGWVIGTGEHIDDVKAGIQGEVLRRIVHKRFGKDGYFFGSLFGGDPLFTNGMITEGNGSIWELSDPNGVKIIQEQNRAAEKEGGGFVNYAWRKMAGAKPSQKISYVMAVPEWEWIIGAGIYLDTIDAQLNAKKDALYSEFLRKAICCVFMLIILMLLIYWRAERITRKVRAGLDAFADFFQKAASEAVFIDPVSLPFSEFGDIALHANRMVKDRMTASAALRESEDKYRMLFENMAQGVFYQRLGGTLTDVNRSALDILGVSREHFLGSNSMDPEWRVIDEKGVMLKGAEHPSMLAMKTGKSVRNVIAGIFNPMKGKYVWVSINAIPLPRAKGEKTEVVFGTLHDLSDRKQLEDDLKSSEARYRALFDNNPVQTVIVNKAGEITMYNFAREKQRGRLPVLGSVMYRDYAVKHERDMHGELMECMASGVQKEFPESQYKQRTLHIRISPFSEGAIITAIDITETRTLHDQLQQARKMEAIGTLAGGVAHDFNNILGIIMGNLELALNAVPENNRLRKRLTEIRTASRRARDVVRQLLSYSRKAEQDRVAIRLQELVDESVGLLRASLPATIAIQTQVRERLGSIRADATQIHRVIINLCNNAAQAMEEIGGTLTLGLDEVTLGEARSEGGHEIPPGEYVRLTVADTGPGMTGDIKEKVFDPYFTTKEIGKGTGMGLSVVQGIVSNHDGAVWVASEPGKGTTVRVLFPVFDEVPISELPVARELPRGNERILFVDDEEGMGLMWQMAFGELGYLVEPVEDPLEALELYRNDPERFDLVITDMTMPGMTGDRLVKEMLEIEPAQPIILCSGYSEKINSESVAAMGIAKYMEKPVELREFATAVREVLDRADDMYLPASGMSV